MKNIPMRKRSPATRQGSTVHVSWTESLAFCGPYPVAHKRFYKIETLKSALEKALQERDRFLYAGIQNMMGQASLTAVVCDFVYEDALRLVFRITASNRSRKRIASRLIVAKNHEECSARILEEYESLTLLHKRAPEQVVAPCCHGVVFLPDRHRRRDINREVFAYITKDFHGAAPLYVASNTQLAPHAAKPHRYSVKDSELLKATLTRLTALLYDERAASGLDPAGLYPECLAAGRNENGAPTLLLAQCRSLRRRFRPQALVHNLLFSTLKTGTAVFPIAPSRPDHFLDALCGAVSADAARAWCKSFLANANKISAHEHEELLPGRDYLAALADLI